MALKPTICGSPRISLPDGDCSECAYLEREIEEIKALLARYEEILVSKRDSNGNEINVMFLGRVVEEEE